MNETAMNETAINETARPSPTALGEADHPHRQELVRLLGALATEDGITPSALPGLDLMRVSEPRPPAPVVYDSCLCVVAQGRKRVYLEQEVYTYDPFHYLVLSVPLPVEGEIFEASPEKPFLAIRLAVDPEELGEMLLALGDDAPRSRRSPQRGIFVSQLSGVLEMAVLRLVRSLGSPGDRRVLGPMAAKEVLYHVLTGEQGGLLRAGATEGGRSHRVARVVRYLQTHYAEPIDIPQLARSVAMSPSTLHHTFKAVTATSPLQYLKKIRLHQARRLLLNGQSGVGEAAFQVGYGSPSQFSREYKRFFGAAPSQDGA